MAVVEQTAFENSYADFGWRRSFQQVKHHLDQRTESEKHLRDYLAQVELAEQRMRTHFDLRPIEGMEILEIGPGQGLERAAYFGRKNRVTGMDTDVIARGFEVGSYLKMLRHNGVGRVVKTVGRELLVNRPNRAVWKRLIGAEKLS